MIIDTQDTGVYNLIGISWGGALSIEISRHLENMGKKVQLFLIDGVPDTLKSLVEQDGDGIKERLLQKLLNFNTMEVNYNSEPFFFRIQYDL